MAKSQVRFYQIDLLRFLAAISVVFFHYCFRGYAADDMSSVSFDSFVPLVKYGYLGVDLFFMISGFVILMSAQGRSLKSFIVSRVTRLYPAFWIGVLLTSLMCWLFNQPLYSVTLLQVVQNLTMFSGYFDVPHVDGVYWTLLIELHFYLIVAIVLGLGAGRYMTHVMMAWLLLTLVSSFAPLPSLVRDFAVTDWSAYFIAGAFFYLIRLNGIKLIYLIAIGVAYYLSIKFSYWRMLNHVNIYKTEYSPVITLGLITLFFTVMFLISINKLNGLNKRIMLHLGMMTYPLYLIHQNIGFLVLNAYGAVINKYVLLFLLVTVMLVVSYLITHSVEPKISRWLKNKLVPVSAS
jgi:peptidoglycan/LPS O-acetylase OafA/YrhL